MHAFGPLEMYPSVAHPKYEYPGGTIQEYTALASALNIERMVYVQPSYYGTDNRFLFEALRALGTESRGVMILPDSMAEPGDLAKLHTLGIRGIRIDLFKMHDRGAAESDYTQALRHAAALARPVGWHVELYSPGIVIRHLTPYLAELGVPVSINHMGYMKNDGELSVADFHNFVAAVKSGNIWVKLTGPYRISSDDAWSYADRIAHTLIDAAPDRMLWGTDWPHIPDCDLDTGMLLNRLAIWCPDEALRNRILVDNPAHLYGFA